MNSISPGKSLSIRGVTLLELVIATTILSVGFLAFIASYSAISRSIAVSRAKTLGSNFAQEKIEKLKSLSYYKIIATQVPKIDSSVSPAIEYDDTYFPPEDIETNSQIFTRYTCIKNLQEVGGDMVAVSANTDTGMKKIIVNVVWVDKGEKKCMRLENIVSNPSMVMYNSKLTGNIRETGTLIPIENAQILVTENIGWQDLTDSSGNYEIDVLQGNYLLNISAYGFFSASKLVGVASNETQTNDFFLNRMSSGTLRNVVWLQDHAVISQIVGSSGTSAGMYSQEYVELYNPTTSYLIMATGSSSEPLVKLFYQKYDDSSPTDIQLEYSILESSIPPNSYYLIANTSTIVIMGSTVTADAVYSYTTYPNEADRDIIKTPEAGGVGIFSVPEDRWLDKIGWFKNHSTPSTKQTPKIFESMPIIQDAGLTDDEQYVRRSSTGGFASGWGRCYDSNSNNVDFIDLVNISTIPRNSTFEEIAMTGTPAIGAVASADDGFSGPVPAYSVGNPPWAEFRLMYVATGTWTCTITSSSYYVQFSSIDVTPNSVQWIPNSLTVSTWPAAGCFYSLLNEKTQMGFISGKITDGNNQPINPMSVKVTQQVPTSSQGLYFVAAPTGTCTITANSDNANPLFVSDTKTVDVFEGQVTSGVDFILCQGGRVSGFVTRDGVNPLPNVSITAFDSNGISRGEDITKANGNFYIVNLATGAYTFEAVLDSKESSNPVALSGTVTSGCNIHVGTMTVINTLGTIAGDVTVGGKKILTGVLLVASDVTIASDPPAISSATLTSNAYYATSSLEDGTYSFEVRGSTTTTYNVYAWYPIIGSGGSTSYPRRAQTGVTVLPGLTTSGVNFSW